MYYFTNDEVQLRKCVYEWNNEDVKEWLIQQNLLEFVEPLCENSECIDGLTLVTLTENELKYFYDKPLSLKKLKHLYYRINILKLIHEKECTSLLCKKVKTYLTTDSYVDNSRKWSINDAHYQYGDYMSNQNLMNSSSASLETSSTYDGLINSGHLVCDNVLKCTNNKFIMNDDDNRNYMIDNNYYNVNKKVSIRHSMPINTNNIMKSDEVWKCFISFIYYLIGCFCSCLTMAFSHNRVPDMTQYPPLPDIILDILPLITWAFTACELLIMTMMTIFFVIVLFHKHRLILLKRFFAICGTIFGMRSVTLTVTTLSVPGRHLECRPEDYTGFVKIISRAFEIMRGGGLSLNGLRTCGDYMFSGHTSYVTVLLMFITEYSSSKIYLLHNAVCVMWGFAVFFVLAGHEHYTIDVVCAIYIASRIFHHYHTLATAVSFSRRKAKMWHPIFYYLEYPFDNAHIHNEFENPINIVYGAKNYLKSLYNRHLKVK